MAELVAHLLSQNSSVLVTAMTNRALIELAEKDSCVVVVNDINKVLIIIHWWLLRAKDNYTSFFVF